MPPRRHDWDTIRTAYIEGLPDGEGGIWWPTPTEVARMYEVSRSTLLTRSGKEKWTEKREEFQRAVEIQRRQGRIDAMAERGAEIDLSTVETAERALKLIAAYLDAPDDLTIAKLKDLGTAAKTWYEVAQAGLGDIPQLQIQLAAEVEHTGEVQIETVSREERIEHVELVLRALAEGDVIDLPPEILELPEAQ